MHFGHEDNAGVRPTLGSLPEYEWAHQVWHKAVAEFAASKGMASQEVLTDLSLNLSLRVKFAEAVASHVRGVASTCGGQHG